MAQIFFCEWNGTDNTSVQTQVRNNNPPAGENAWSGSQGESSTLFYKEAGTGHSAGNSIVAKTTSNARYVTNTFAEVNKEVAIRLFFRVKTLG